MFDLIKQSNQTINDKLSHLEDNELLSVLKSYNAKSVEASQALSVSPFGSSKHALLQYLHKHTITSRGAIVGFISNLEQLIRFLQQLKYKLPLVDAKMDWESGASLIDEKLLGTNVIITKNGNNVGIIDLNNDLTKVPIKILDNQFTLTHTSSIPKLVNDIVSVLQ